MRTKKMQQGGMPPMNKMGQRKAMTNSAAKKRGDTFREPEHGGPSMPLAADVERNFTGTTAMGDPYTATQDVIGDIEVTTPGQLTGYETVFDADGNPTGQTAIYADDTTETVQGVIGSEEAPSAEVSGSGSDPLQTGEQGMMLKKKNMRKGGSMQEFESGGFSVMDPADFVRMLRDNRKK